MNKFKIQITSPPERDNLVAEIWWNDSHVAEINIESGEFEIELYKPVENEYWTFPLKEFLEVIHEAKKRLT